MPRDSTSAGRLLDPPCAPARYPSLMRTRLECWRERQSVERLRYGNGDVRGGIGGPCLTLVEALGGTPEGGVDSQLDPGSWSVGLDCAQSARRRETLRGLRAPSVPESG